MWHQQWNWCRWRTREKRSSSLITWSSVNQEWQSENFGFLNMVYIYFSVFGLVFSSLVRVVVFTARFSLSILFLLGASPSLQSNDRDFLRLPSELGVSFSFVSFRFFSVSLFHRSVPSHDHCLSIRLPIDVSSRCLHNTDAFPVLVSSYPGWHRSFCLHIHRC